MTIFFSIRKKNTFTNFVINIFRIDNALFIILILLSEKGQNLFIFFYNFFNHIT